MSQENNGVVKAQAIEIETIPSCSVPSCRDTGELLPGFDYLNKQREPGDFIKPHELADYALCGKHARNVGNAARHRGEGEIHFYPYSDSLCECREIHKRIKRRRLEEKERDEKKRIREESEKTAAEARRKAIEQQQLADKAAAEFRAQLEARQAKAKAEETYKAYMAKLQPGTMADFKDNSLPEEVGCVFSECTCQDEHGRMFVPDLNTLKDSLGREVEEADLSAFALCLKDMKLVAERSGLRFHKLGASVHLIRTYGPARKAAQKKKAEQDKAAEDYLSRLGLVDCEPKPSQPKAEKSNVVELNTGAMECIGRDCHNIIPADRKTRFCDSCAHQCPGCGHRIPKWYKLCQECQERSAIKGGETKTARRKREKREEAEKKRLEEEARRKAEAKAKADKAAIEEKLQRKAEELGADLSKEEDKKLVFLELVEEKRRREEEKVQREAEKKLPLQERLERAAAELGADLTDPEQLEIIHELVTND